jgi:hypothetical protein
LGSGEGNELLALAEGFGLLIGIGEVVASGFALGSGSEFMNKAWTAVNGLTNDS